jgi:hypothetical protein
METLGELLQKWPQNDLDTPPTPFVERLQHFDFNDPEQMKIAERYRDLEFPFKLTNVPELLAANEKWTDEYLSFHFDRNRKKLLRAADTIEKHSKEFSETYGHIPPSEGHCQESMDSFFAFFTAKNWNTHTMGEVPTKDTDFTFAKWQSMLDMPILWVWNLLNHITIGKVEHHLKKDKCPKSNGP